MGGDRATELSRLESKRRCAYSGQVNLVRSWRKVGACGVAVDANCVKAGRRRVGCSLVDQRICPAAELNGISPATAGDPVAVVIGGDGIGGVCADNSVDVREGCSVKTAACAERCVSKIDRDRARSMREVEGIASTRNSVND